MEDVGAAARLRLALPLQAQRRLLLGPGPSNVPPRVAAAGALPMISHTDPAFFEVRAPHKYHAAVIACHGQACCATLTS